MYSVLWGACVGIAQKGGGITQATNHPQGRPMILVSGEKKSTGSAAKCSPLLLAFAAIPGVMGATTRPKDLHMGKMSTRNL
jgi:hypothetical protein